jgi:prepilin-type N-terminal cleavage/methylation domain-containing protein/prepilin-type processing-associated H-X9-DG protein
MVRCYGWDGSRRRGFSLVELLVVMGIIALLIGILVPTIVRARMKSNAAACKAQLHDIGSSFQMYLNDHRGRYPLAPTLPSANTSGYQTLQVLLAPYSGESMRVFKCPSDDVIYLEEEGISYFYYAELGLKPLKETYIYAVLQSPNQVPILWDAANYHGGSVPFNWLFADGHVAEFLDSAEADTLPPPS